MPLRPTLWPTPFILSMNRSSSRPSRRLSRSPPSHSICSSPFSPPRRTSTGAGSTRSPSQTTKGMTRLSWPQGRSRWYRGRHSFYSKTQPRWSGNTRVEQQAGRGRPVKGAASQVGRGSGAGSVARSRTSSRREEEHPRAAQLEEMER